MKKIFVIALGAIVLSSCAKLNEVKIVVDNKSDLKRDYEMAEVSWHLVKERLKLAEGETFIVLNNDGEQVPYQLVSYGEQDAELLIFPVTLSPKESANFKIVKGAPEKFEDQVQVTFMPQRKDDISWENDKAAFRMYGPALEVDPSEAMVSGGIDLWVKSTPKLVTQQWYKDDLAKVKSYHEDHGEGLDFYSVGKTLGAGAAAPIKDDTLFYISHNFVSHEILDNGPLRMVFKLTYAPYEADGIEVNETRLVSLDAGSCMNKITENYGKIDKALQIAAGFPYYGNDTYTMNGPEGYLSYAEPTNEKHGIIYLGVVSDVPLIDTKIAQNQLLAVMDYQPSYSAGRGLSYYSGGGWSKGGFPTFEDWTNYVKDFSLKVRNPLLVSIMAE